MESSKTMIQTISFSKFDKWYVSYYLNPNRIESLYNLVKLKEILIPTKVRIRKDEYNGDFPIVAKISFNDGEIHLRKERKTGMDLYQLEKDNLLVSKINFHQGAVAINKIGTLVSSTHYQPYKVNSKKIIGDYLILCLRSNGFLDFIKFLRADGIKNEATYEFISELQIPLPLINEQKRILAAYNTKINLAKDQKTKANTLKQGINEYLSDVLGIKQDVNIQFEKGLKFVSYSNISRWDTLFLIGNIPSLNSNYNIEKFSNVIKDFNKEPNSKSLRINSSNYPNQEFHYIGMEDIEKETGNLQRLNKVLGKEIKSQTLRIPKNFLIYGKLRPYLNKYWINETEYDDIICSSEFFVFDIKKSIDKQFFKYVLASKIIQIQINDKTSGARMPRINEEIFLNLQFPLPPIKEQINIAKYITNQKNEISKLNFKAEQNISSALIEFEQEIFTN